jgi:hypothetical protein
MIQAVSHVHSEWSYDASWQLDRLAEQFRRNGARVLLMTEHDRGFSAERLEQFRKACGKVTSPDLLVVPGIEYSDAANLVHVLVWGPVPFLGENLSTREMLSGVKAHNGVAVLAHPSRRDAWKSFEASWSDALLGIEVWNRKYDGWAPSKTARPLLEEAGAVPFVGLDFHTARQSFPLTMAMGVTGAVCEESVLDAMRDRRLEALAFGVSLDRRLFKRIVPTLGMAEQARKSAAKVARKASNYLGARK